MSNLPHFIRVRQNFPAAPAPDILAAISGGFDRLKPQIKKGSRIAVGVGSRGIANLPEIVAGVLLELRNAGAEPFLFPAMGSHGGATPEGQREVLESYGITAAAMGVPIHASLDVREAGVADYGVPVFCSSDALDADGIVLINRIKPHTDFSGNLGSGLLKMAVVGLGKRIGATIMHGAASRFGYEAVIRAMARVLIARTPILCGVAILENQYHQTAQISVISASALESAEDALFVRSKALMPGLPFEEIDLLIIDQIGKNISGVGMDPNVIARSVHGYSSTLSREERPAPFIRRILARDLTPETHGNAIGIGLADFTTKRLVEAIDHQKTYLNALTALTPQSVKVPPYFASDREAIDIALTSLALPDGEPARIVRIANTLMLEEMEISQSLWETIPQNPALSAISSLRASEFDAEGNLI